MSPEPSDTERHAALRQFVAGAETFRQSLLRDLEAGEREYAGAGRAPAVLGLLMFYGDAFRGVLEMPLPRPVDSLYFDVFDTAGLGLITFRGWQLSRTSLEHPSQISDLDRIWENVLTRCQAPPDQPGMHDMAWP